MNIQEQDATIQMFLQGLSWLLPKIHMFLSPKSYTYEDVTLTIRPDGTSMIYLQKGDSNVRLDRLAPVDIKRALLRLTHIANSILTSGEIPQIVARSDDAHFIVVLYSMLNISSRVSLLDNTHYTLV